MEQKERWETKMVADYGDYCRQRFYNKVATVRVGWATLNGKQIGTSEKDCGKRVLSLYQNKTKNDDDGVLDYGDIRCFNAEMNTWDNNPRLKDTRCPEWVNHCFLLLFHDNQWWYETHSNGRHLRIPFAIKRKNQEIRKMCEVVIEINEINDGCSKIKKNDMDLDIILLKNEKKITKKKKNNYKVKFWGETLSDYWVMENDE